MRTVDARAAAAAALLFLVAAMWLFVLGFAGWLGVTVWQLLILLATQAAWLIGAALLAGWRWARPTTLLYAAFELVLALWSASVGLTVEYTTVDWLFTGVVGAAAVLTGALVAKPFAT